MSPNEEVLQRLPNDTVRDALLEIIDENINSKDYVLHMEKGSAAGDNYLGIVHRLSVTYSEETKEGNAKQQTLGVFIKVPPDNIKRREEFFARPCFLREADMYTEFLPLITEFQESKGINPEEDGFREFAHCYKSITHDLNEAVFMEDLRLKDFVMHNRFESPSVDLVKVVVKALGKLHAMSFALKDQEPEKFSKFEALEEIFAGKSEDSLFASHVNMLSEIAGQSIAQDDNAEYNHRLKAFFAEKSMYTRMQELVDGSKAKPYAVICHGDCWNNNVLFKFENGKPVEARLIDWQLSRYASPVCDLMYYIFCCTTKPLRDKHYEDIIDTYYTELATFLKRLGSDPERLFPREALDDQLKQFGIFGLIMGLMVIPTITTKAENVPDLDELSEKIGAGDEEFMKKSFEMNMAASMPRIRDVVIDMFRLGYLQ